MQLFAVFTELAVYVLFRASADFGMRGKLERRVAHPRNVLASYIGRLVCLVRVYVPWA